MILNIFNRFAPCWAINLFLWFKLSKLDKRRIHEINKWLECADHVAKATRHAEARTIVTFLRENLFHITPTAGGFRAIHATKNMNLPVTVLMSEDIHVGGIWKEQIECRDRNMANLMKDHDGNTIALVLKGFLNPSDLAKGLLFLHEGKHAQINQAGRVLNDEGMLAEEVSVLEFECRLVELYFGHEYSQLVDYHAEKVLKLSRNGRDPIQEAWFKAAFEDFCRRFHVPFGETEKRLLDSNLMYAVMFRYLEKCSPCTVKSDKLKFVSFVKQVSESL